MACLEMARHGEGKVWRTVERFEEVGLLPFTAHTINVIMMAEEEFFSLKIKKGENMVKNCFFMTYLLYIPAQEILSPLFFSNCQNSSWKIEVLLSLFTPKTFAILFSSKTYTKRHKSIKRSHHHHQHWTFEWCVVSHVNTQAMLYNIVYD